MGYYIRLMTPLRLFLASASPRRRTLLQQVGLKPTPLPQHVDEKTVAGETPRGLVVRLAETKGRSAERVLSDSPDPALIIAADTEVVLGEEVLGKPRDSDHARAMLQRLSGREHEVMTGVFICRTDNGSSAVGVESTCVRFRALDAATISSYVSSGEPLDKAGAYGIQGRGALLTAGIEGSWSNVVGFPLERLPDWLKELGVDIHELTDSS